VKHQWFLEKDGKRDDSKLDVYPTPDDFRGHNGPMCQRCGLLFCIHCQPELLESECDGVFKEARFGHLEVST
jgi:hypothetical protein